MSSTTKRAVGGAITAAFLAAAFHPTTATATTNQSFQRLATYPVYKNLPANVPASSTTVAEISDVTADGKTVIYTDALGKRIGFLDISDPHAPEGAGSISLETLGDVDDEPTSVAVVGKYVLVVVDTSPSFVAPSGRLDIIRIADSKRIRSIDLEGQPDSIAISPDEDYAAIAIENQRDEEFAPVGGDEGDLPQLPAGFVQVLDLDGSNPNDWVANRVDLVNDDATALQAFIDADVVEPTDPEPEYVSINDNNKLALTLQENNAVVILDLPTRAIDKVFSAGSVTLTGIDAKKDNKISLTDTLTDVAREPDAINWVDSTHVATANEGDWKGGSRGWSVFDTTTGVPAWDAGNSFERLAVKYGLFNNDRAAKKGSEAEGISVSTIDGVRYAFVGSERSNFVAVYDLTNPTSPVFKQVLPATNGPEGILPIPSRNMLVVSSETDDASLGVRASVSIYQLGAGKPRFPSIISNDVDGAPIGWSALGALSAVPGEPGKLWAAADTVLQPGQIFAVDTSAGPARITRAISVTDNGAPANIDIEGIFARPQGGFWLASEGATGPANKLYRANATGGIETTINLPADVSAHISKWGFEGVTATTDAQGEHVWVALQRELWTDPADQTSTVDGEGIVRIGRYDTATTKWTWYGYELANPLRNGTDWVGLSEITAIDANTFAVIERDKLNGPAARNKRIYTFDVPATDPAPGTLPLLEKKLAYDVLPDLRATNGWTQEKLEGLTIGADGYVYAVTDNDGLKDSTGETVFLKLGKATDVFDDELASTTTMNLSKTSVRYGEKVTSTVRVTGGTGIAVKGPVEIRSGSTVVGRGTVTNGVGTVTLAQVAPGTRQLKAYFAGATNVGASTSESITLKVAKALTSTQLDVNRTTVKQGKSVTVDVSVTSPTYVPGGRVEIRDKGKVVKTVTLVGGKASVKVTLKSKGVHKLRAVYLGSTYAEPSVSPKVTVVVTS
ncbi:esterase-like activity of phytase family protein [soil metagenome]